MTAALIEKAERLRRLHAGPHALVLANAWDVASARLIAALGAPAIATSSAGVAYALGYADGERIPRAEMLDMIRRVAAAVAVPVTADVEGGYGATARAAAETARGVIAAGAVGINLEDAGDGDRLLDAELHADRVRAARAAGAAAGVPLVINARTDAFEAPGTDAQRFAEAVRRANLYLAAGADCAFVPFTSDRDTIARLVKEIHGPINVLATKASPPIAELERLGVRRVSVGSGIARAAYSLAQRAARELLERGTYGPIAEATLTHADLQRLFGA
jgi:2-methylisocitrate lyase-like PEP mutase family enzyme